jgi:hypothetical protein
MPSNRLAVAHGLQGETLLDQSCRLLALCQYRTRVTQRGADAALKLDNTAFNAVDRFALASESDALAHAAVCTTTTCALGITRRVWPWIPVIANDFSPAAPGQNW